MLLAMMLDRPSKTNDQIIAHMIDKGCNVNISDHHGQTPMHNAVLRLSTSVALKLIRSGANINAQDDDGDTPLHKAVAGNNMEAICMLLYHQADANIVNKMRYTPFVQSLDNCTRDYNTVMANWLLNYSGTFAGKFALMSKYQNLFRYAIDEIPMLVIIRKIWDKFDHHTMIRDKCTFLTLYLIESMFTIRYWLNCLYSMLSTPDAEELMAYKFRLLDSFSVSHFSDVYCSLLSRNVQSLYRVQVISLWLYFGARVYISDVTKAFAYFGMDEEVMRLISSTPVPLLTLLFALEDPGRSTTFRSIIIYKFIPAIRRARTHKLTMGLMCISLQFFAWSHHERLMLLHQLDHNLDDYMKVVKILEKQPRRPSLVELCRNRIVMTIKRNLVRRPRHILDPVKFHMVIKKLDVTQHVKDILQFKKPVYI